MKILLIKPPSISDHIQPPLGLAYLANSVRDKHDVAILDMLKKPTSPDAFRRLVQTEAYDLVGFQCYTQELQSVSELSRLIKQVNPRTVTLAGGPHPTLLPRETMECLGANMDYLLRGESDETFPRFVEYLAQGRKHPEQIPGLVWKAGDHLTVSEVAPQPQALDLLPLPAWDLIQPQSYPPAQHGAFFERFPIAPISTTRGCPFACKFCSAPVLSGQRMRFRGADSILQEMQLLYTKFGIREFHIIDDNFTMRKAHAQAVLEKIIASGMKISLAFPNGIRTETVDEELLALMKKSGVYLISLGLESGSNRVLQLMNKKLTTEKSKEKIKLIHQAKMDLAAFFIMGFPGETEADIRQTIDYALRLPLLRANFFDFLPLPGTPIYYELEEKGELEKIDWTKFHFMTAPYTPRGLTRKKLRRFQRRAFLQFYLRPWILFRHLLLIKSFRHFTYLMRRFYHWILM